MHDHLDTEGRRLQLRCVSGLKNEHNDARPGRVREQTDANTLSKTSAISTNMPQGQATTGWTTVSYNRRRHLDWVVIAPGKLEHLVHGVVMSGANVPAASTWPACILLVFPKSMMVLKPRRSSSAHLRLSQAMLRVA